MEEDPVPQGREGALELDERRFAVHSERHNTGEYVRVTGEMDLSVIGLVDREMQRAEASDAARIVLDLGELEFLDASGIRLLLHLTARSQDDGQRLRIRAGRSPQVRRVLELTGVDELLPLEV
jgi:anti-anti-sigma factor